MKLAEQLNPDFKNPNIIGGYLRNIILGATPKDCDVVFQGKELNQPGVLEAVQEAEQKLGVIPYLDWEFENATATGVSDDFYDDIIGKYAHHTDYLTDLCIDTNGKVHIYKQKVLQDLETRTYDLRFAGVEIWVNHRNKGRSYTSCIIGDLTRALYLGRLMNLNFSMVVEFLLNNLDMLFNQLSSEDQERRKSFWMKKTKGDVFYQPILDRFSIKSFTTSI